MSFLPGMFPAGAAGLVNEIRLTHIATTQGGTSLTFPASGIEAGDLLIYIGGAYQLGTDDPPAITTPTGFTQIREDSSNPSGTESTRDVCAYKIAIGDEDGTVVNVSGTATTDGEAAVLLQFRPSSPIGSVGVVGSDYEGTGGEPDSQVLGTGEQFSLHVAFYQSSQSIDTRTYTPAADAEVDITSASGGDAYAKYKVMNPPSVAVAVTVDMNDEGFLNVLTSFILLASPA